MSQFVVESIDPLERLADRCLDARALIDEAGLEAMRPLIDLLLFEVGRALVRKSSPGRGLEAQASPRMNACL